MGRDPRLCRLDRPDPIAAWQAHLDSAGGAARSAQRKRYSALKYAGPAPTSRSAFPTGHLWVSGRRPAGRGIAFAPNMPTEEVFTMPHKARGRHGAGDQAAQLRRHADRGLQRFASKRAGREVAPSGRDRAAAARRHRRGAGRLGEVALVPHSSPISQSGLLFYNTLFDENAASHVALGSAYKFTLNGGDAMDDEQFGPPAATAARFTSTS